jgi:F-type H+-transporting ATPase subunit alpha
MQLARGERLVEILKQGQYVPLPVEKQALVIYAATNGHIDDYPVEALAKYEEELYHFMDNRYADLIKDLADKKEITDEIKPRLEEALATFKSEFVYE